MADSRRLLVWLAYAVAIAVVISAIGQVIFATGLLVKWPDPAPGTNIVDSSLLFRAFDQQVFGLVFVNDVVGLIAFLLIAFLGVALRPFAAGGTARDLLATILVIAGAVGIVAQLLDVGIAHAATANYCDCGFKETEVIAQNYSLEIGRTVQFWTVNGSFALIGIGTAMAGRLLTVTPTWKWLSYLIATILVFVSLVRLLLEFVNLNVDLGTIVDVISAVGSGILVPIWAVLLARAMSRGNVTQAGA